MPTSKACGFESYLDYYNRLSGYQSAITGLEVKDGMAFYTTQRINYFVPGQAVIISGCGAAFWILSSVVQSVYVVVDTVP